MHELTRFRKHRIFIEFSNQYRRHPFAYLDYDFGLVAELIFDEASSRPGVL